MNGITRPEQLMELAHEVSQARSGFLKWKYICERYERGKHVKCGEILRRIRSEEAKEGKKTAVEELKLLVYSDPEYAKYLAEWDNAEKKRTTAQISFENADTALEAARSMFAYKRDELRQGIHDGAP